MNIPRDDQEDSLAVCENSQGVEIRGNLLPFTRYLAGGTVSPLTSWSLHITEDRSQ